MNTTEQFHNLTFLLCWDISNIIENEVEYRKQEAKLSKQEFCEEKVRTEVSEDPFLFEMEWEQLGEDITDIMKKISLRNSVFGYWYADVE